MQSPSDLVALSRLARAGWGRGQTHQKVQEEGDERTGGGVRYVVTERAQDTGDSVGFVWPVCPQPGTVPDS